MKMVFINTKFVDLSLLEVVLYNHLLIGLKKKCHATKSTDTVMIYNQLVKNY